LYDQKYVLNYTNALIKVTKEYKLEDGLFSGYNEKTRKYAVTSWGYQLGPDKKPLKAENIEDPDCVFAKLKTHYSRYTFETAEKISGIPAAKIKEIADEQFKLLFNVGSNSLVSIPNRQLVRSALAKLDIRVQ